MDSAVTGPINRPLLRPAADEQNGYVPNVVYSGGVPLPELLTALVERGATRVRRA